MFIAMNRFKVAKGQEWAFESVWPKRRSRLPEMPGFISFRLLKGPERADYILYSSHTIWETKRQFIAWTGSQQFADAHRDAGKIRPLFIDQPEFEGFEVVLSEDNPHVPAQAAE